MDGITFSALLTAAGAGIAAGIVTSVVSLVKTALPIAVDWNGAALAFGASAVLYVLAAFATGVNTLDGALGVFLAWLTCSTAAVGLHKTIVRPALAKMQS